MNVSKKDVNRFIVFLSLCPFSTYDKRHKAIIVNLNNYDKLRYMMFKIYNVTHYYKVIRPKDQYIYIIKLPKIPSHMVLHDNQIVVKAKTLMFLKPDLLNLLFKVYGFKKLKHIDRFATKFSDTSKKNLKLLSFQYIPYHEVYVKETVISNNRIILKQLTKYIQTKPFIIRKMIRRKFKHLYPYVEYKLENNDLEIILNTKPHKPLQEIFYEGGMKWLNLL